MYERARTFRTAQRQAETAIGPVPGAAGRLALGRVRKLLGAFRVGLPCDRPKMQFALCDTLGGAEIEAERLFALGWLRWLEGEPAVADDLFAESVRVARQLPPRAPAEGEAARGELPSLGTSALLARSAYWGARVGVLCGRADAVAEYELVLRALAGSPQATAWFVDLLWRAGRVDRAEQVWKSVRGNRRVSGCDEGPLLEARGLLRRGEVGPAERVLQEAAPVGGVSWVERRLLLAWALKMQGHRERALALMAEVRQGPYPTGALDIWLGSIASGAEGPIPFFLEDFVRGQEARLAGRAEEAATAYRAALTSPIALPFARYALACLGQDDPAAVLASQPGLFIAVRCRARVALERFRLRQASPVELLDALRQAGPLPATGEHFGGLAQALRSPQSDALGLRDLVRGAEKAAPAEGRNVLRAALELAVRRLPAPEALALLRAWASSDLLAGDPELRQGVGRQLLRLALLQRDASAVATAATLLPGDALVELGAAVCGAPVVAGSPDPATAPVVAGSPDPATAPVVAGSPDPATAPVVAGSPDPATALDRRSPLPQQEETSGRAEWHGRETVPQPGRAEWHGRETVPQPGRAEWHGRETVPQPGRAEWHGRETVPQPGRAEWHGRETVPQPGHALRLWQAAQALPTADEAWRAAVQGLRTQSRLRPLAQALLLQEAAVRGDVPAVAALLEEVDAWRGFRTGPPAFVVRAVEAVLLGQSAHPAWRRSLPRWLQVWGVGAIGPGGAALAAHAGLTSAPADVTPPAGTAPGPWFLHQAARALGRDDARSALAFTRRALSLEAELPEAETVRAAVPELERLAQAQALASCLGSIQAGLVTDLVAVLRELPAGMAVLEAAERDDVESVQEGLTALAERPGPRLAHHLALVERRAAQVLEEQERTDEASPHWQRSWDCWLALLSAEGAVPAERHGPLLDHLLSTHRRCVTDLLARDEAEAARRHWGLVAGLPVRATPGSALERDLTERVANFREELATEYLLTTREAMRYGDVPEGWRADYVKGLAFLTRLLALDGANRRLLTALVEVCAEWFMDLYNVVDPPRLREEVERYAPFAEELGRLVEGRPGDLSGRAALADFYKFRGFVASDRERKVAMYREALRFNPANGNVRELLTELGEEVT